MTWVNTNIINPFNETVNPLYYLYNGVTGTDASTGSKISTSERIASFGYAGMAFVPGGGEAGAEGRAIEGASNDLLQEARTQYPGKAGKIEMHHVAPRYLGGAKNGLVVPLDAAYHQMITNEFRLLHPYGKGALSEIDRLNIMKQVYTKYPIPGFKP